MLLYATPQAHYLAVPLKARFEAPGYAPCFGGRDVPEVICQAFIRESGGQALTGPLEEIELRAPVHASY